MPHNGILNISRTLSTLFLISLIYFSLFRSPLSTTYSEMLSVISENLCDLPWCHEMLAAHPLPNPPAVHRHLQPLRFRAGELNQKQWVQDALWDRPRGLHDHQGRTCFVHTAHWHTSAPHSSQTAPSTATVLWAAVNSAPRRGLCSLALFQLSHTGPRSLDMDNWVSLIRMLIIWHDTGFLGSSKFKVQSKVPYCIVKSEVFRSFTL